MGFWASHVYLRAAKRKSEAIFGHFQLPHYSKTKLAKANDANTPLFHWSFSESADGHKTAFYGSLPLSGKSFVLCRLDVANMFTRCSPRSLWPPQWLSTPLLSYYSNKIIAFPENSLQFSRAPFIRGKLDAEQFRPVITYASVLLVYVRAYIIYLPIMALYKMFGKREKFPCLHIKINDKQIETKLLNLLFTDARFCYVLVFI